MAKEAQVRCRCGEVVGLVTNASPQKVNRAGRSNFADPAYDCALIFSAACGAK